MSRLDQEFGQSGAQTWSSIHRILGVNSIEDIHLEQYNPTEAILQQLFEIAQLRSSLANRGDGADESVPIVQEALTTLTERNGRLVTELDQQRRAYGELEQRFKKQADAMQSLRASTATAEGKANRWMDSLLKAADRVEELQKEIANQETRVANLTASLAVAEERAGSAKLNFRAIAVALFFATACGAVLWYKAHSSEKALAQLQSQSKQCMFAGKPYAIGSIIDNPSAPDVECVLSEHGKSPEWRTIKQTRTNRR
ncbi:hypothetical protein WS72_13450 [Burkholderia savannae]|uniref:Uncharacterized protein n=1 Tax=Burkholderia savannae TaxID=1637837 RepID=A0ABR5TFK2_9BURK|nr:hypothetical protein WS72_13450 [Burkholderia savannae]